MSITHLPLGFAVLALTSAGAWAGNISLDTDYGVRGALHYCRYSNGKVYAFEAGKECPGTMAEPPDRGGRGTGYLKSEAHEGDSKLCIYNVSGMERSIRVTSFANCPLNQEF